MAANQPRPTTRIAPTQISTQPHHGTIPG
jgi:hypothetical protein